MDPFVTVDGQAYDRLGDALVSPFYGMVGVVVTDDTYDLAGAPMPTPSRCCKRARALRRFSERRQGQVLRPNEIAAAQ
jgi:hypothetical protein